MTKEQPKHPQERSPDEPRRGPDPVEPPDRPQQEPTAEDEAAGSEGGGSNVGRGGYTDAEGRRKKNLERPG